MEIEPSAVSPALAATVSVVDDDPSMLRAIDRLFSSAGLEAQLFSDPLGFLTYAKCHSVAVAVIDLWMPGVSGFQVKEELQAISPKTRVIIITATDDDSVRNQAMQGGTSALFIKPIRRRRVPCRSVSGNRFAI
ncbi:MAG: response regulator [Verrucomicrobia bacterium]|nr:response regulator [Verrucomicrobiota bacterium]